MPIPQAVSDQQAAAAMLQGMTAHYLSHDTYPLKQGETALIHAAAGGVGLLLVQMAHNIGARVIATVSTEEKAKLARAAGAHEVILYTQSDFEAETKRLTAAKEWTLSTIQWERLVRERTERLAATRDDGAVRRLERGRAAVRSHRAVAKRVALCNPASLANYISTRDEYVARSGAVFGMIASGKLELRIGHTYPLAEAQRAHRDLEARKTTGKLLLIP